MQTSSGGAYIFKNNYSRTADGGSRTCTFRNDDGSLRLSAASNSPSILLNSGGTIALTGTLGAQYINCTGFQCFAGGGSQTSLNVVSGSTSYDAIVYIGSGVSTTHLQAWTDGHFYVGNNTFSAWVRLNNGGSSWVSSSDERLKDVIEPISNVLDKVDQVEPVVFSWKHDEEKKRNLGFLAQNLQQSFPDVVDVGRDDMLCVSYTELIPVCFAAIKELRQQIKSMENQIAQLLAAQQNNS